MLPFYLLLVLHVFSFILFPIHILYIFLMPSIRVPCFSHLLRFLCPRCNCPNNILQRELIIKTDVPSAFQKDFDQNTI